MFYYIGINSWNLLESFVSESISPFSFYQVRGYGNNLSRYRMRFHRIYPSLARSGA